MKHVSPDGSCRGEKNITRTSTGSIMDETEITSQSSYEETFAIVEDIRKHVDRQVNIKTAFKEHLGVGLTKILEIVKRETDRSKYAEMQMRDDKLTYTQDVLLVEREHIKRLERILENKEIAVDSKELLKGLEEGMGTLKEQLKKDILQEIRTQKMGKQEIECKGKIDIQSLVPEIRKELEKMVEAPPVQSR